MTRHGRAIEGSTNLNNFITDRAKWSAAERGWRLAGHNFQLLSMLEVLQERSVDDIDHLVAATRMTLVFPAGVGQAERELPIDPTGRTRALLTDSRDKAMLLYRLAVRSVRRETVRPGELPVLARVIRNLADACERLCNWISAHDEVFENPDPTEPMPLAVA